MSVMNRIVFLIIIAVSTAACGGTGGGESSVAEVSPTSTPTTVANPFVPQGESITRPLRNSTEVVRNCQEDNPTIYKEPSRSVSTSHSVEWSVGGETGVGVSVGPEAWGSSVNVEASISATYGQSSSQTTEQGNGWSLPARAGTIMTYELAWTEEWQPGYIEVVFPDQNIVKVDVLIRTGLNSQIINEQPQSCDAADSIEPVSDSSENIVPLHIPPRNLLPLNSDLRDVYILDETEETTNEVLAQYFDDQVESFQQLIELGRVGGHYLIFIHEDDCEYVEGVRSALFSIHTFESYDGARQYFDWSLKTVKESDSFINIESSSEFGEGASIVWYEFESECETETPEILTQIAVRFYRKNVVAIVMHTVVKDSMDDEAILDSISFFTEKIELRIEAEAANR
ncbi:hypothetical protein [Candidatus Leptofilum sp.]|uniref:hypothetical protein n=1 Tax=Candidatus Leptofilum sp. TaxID=3241576 RepID=UPI003B5B8C0E